MKMNIYSSPDLQYRSPGEVPTNSHRRTRIAAANQGTYITVKWHELPEHAEGQVTWTMARVVE
jgi:hypothetical protein